MKSKSSYGYMVTRNGQTECAILPTVKTLASLIRQMPQDAVPCRYDDATGRFTPLATRAA